MTLGGTLLRMETAGRRTEYIYPTRHRAPQREEETGERSVSEQCPLQHGRVRRQNHRSTDFHILGSCGDGRGNQDV